MRLSGVFSSTPPTAFGIECGVERGIGIGRYMMLYDVVLR